MNKMLNKSGKLYERLYKNFQYIDRNKIGKCQEVGDFWLSV